MKHRMPQLPYAAAELAPRLSEETMNYHYGKHLQTYVDNLNKLVTGTLYEDMDLEEIICKASGPIFNNAAQTWNHAFYFVALTSQPCPIGDGLASRLTSAFGSVQAFKEKLLAASAAVFGSGWTWLVADANGYLDIVSTSGAGNPLTDGLFPLLTIDVWEHAYYIDYRNRRPDYLKAIWELIDWRVVEKRLLSGECNVYI